MGYGYIHDSRIDYYISHDDNDVSLMAELIFKDKDDRKIDLWFNCGNGFFVRKENIFYNVCVWREPIILLNPDFVADLEEKYGDIFERKNKKNDNKSKNILLYGFAFLIFFVFGLMIGWAL